MNEENQTPMNEMPQNSNSEPVNNDKGNFGWAVLGFFIPLVGLILYLVWKNTRPGDAKKAGIGALVGFVVNLILNLTVLSSFFNQVLQ
jgi:uncharacterized protein YqgC (DUF456 family)